MRHIHGSAFTSLAGARLTRTAPLLLVLMLSACGNDSESPGTASSKSVHGQTVSGIVQPGTPEAGAQAVSPAHNGLHTKALVPANGSITLTSGAFGKLYGPGVFKQDALANTVVGVQGAYEQKVSNRFRAQHNGQINSVRIYWQAGRQGLCIRNGRYGSPAHPARRWQQPASAQSQRNTAWYGLVQSGHGTCRQGKTHLRRCMVQRHAGAEGWADLSPADGKPRWLARQQFHQQ